jgi:hypothetical protein
MFYYSGDRPPFPDTERITTVGLAPATVVVIDIRQRVAGFETATDTVPAADSAPLVSRA